MKRVLLQAAVAVTCCAGTLATVAPSALAWTKSAAENTANGYAEVHYDFAETGECVNSGKNKAGEAQWYCSGGYWNRGGHWHINVDPYGTITYHSEY